MIALLLGLLTAQAADWKGFNCPKPLYIEGTSGLDAARRNIQTFNRYYTGASLAERGLFPYVATPTWVDREGWRTRAVVDFSYIADSAGLIAMESSSGKCGAVGVHPMDLAVNSMGLLMMHQSGFGITVAGSSTFVGAADNTAERWTTAAMTLFPWTAFYSFASPLLPLFPNARDPWGAQADFLIGAVYDAQTFGTYRLAWSHQGGWVTNVSQENVRLLVSALISPNLDRIPLLRAGFDRIQSKVGYTTLLGRKTDFARLSTEDEATEHRGVILAQDNIFGILDIGVEPAWEPHVRLAHAKLGFHTRGFFDVPVTADPNKVDYVGTGEGKVEVGLEGGLVTLPTLPWYGIEGGTQPYAVLVLRVNSAGPGTEDWETGRKGELSVIDLRFAYNDPEVLLYMPTAQGSLRVGIIGNMQW